MHEVSEIIDRFDKEFHLNRNNIDSANIITDA